MDDEPRTYRTKTGRVLTDADIEALAAEAERGYDVSHLHPRKGLPGSRTSAFFAAAAALAAFSFLGGTMADRSMRSPAAAATMLGMLAAFGAVLFLGP